LKKLKGTNMIAPVTSELSPEDRQKLFADEYTALMERYGVQLVAVLESENLNNSTSQQRAKLAFGIVQDWQPTKSDK
jgi:hypothetical protein